MHRSRTNRLPSASKPRSGGLPWGRGAIGALCGCWIAASSAAAQPSTDVVVLDLYPHLDHVHVGSMIRVTDRDGHDSQPYFVDHDRLLFVSDREGDPTDVFLHTLSTGSLERVSGTPAESEFLPVRREKHLGAPLVDLDHSAWAGPEHLVFFREGDPASLHLLEPATGEYRKIREGVGPSVQPIPGTREVSFVDRTDPDRPVLVRLDGPTGEVTEVAELPPGVVDHAWLSDVTVFMGHRGVLYRSVADPENPWHPILDLGEALGSFSRIAVTSGGRRIAVVVERGEEDGSSHSPAPLEDRTLEYEALIDPAEVGMSAEALQRITEAMEAHVEAGEVAGVVAAVMRDGKRVYHQSVGYREMESRDPMPLDALFRIYSMTRPVTAVGILLLEQDGLLALEDPVEKYLPEFADQRVFLDASAPDLEEVRPRRGSITLADLLLHTSGIGSRSSALYRDHEVHRWDLPLEEVVDRVAALPLFEDPGTNFRYGMHSEILGRVIEVVSGQPLEVFFQERIFAPLEMTETVFFVDPGRAHRLAPVYRPDSDGVLARHEMETIPVTRPRALTSAGVGLVTTVDDFLRFSQALLDGAPGAGTAGGPLLRPETLERIRSNAVPEDLLPLIPRGYWEGSGWSLGGMAVVLDPTAYSHTVHPGEFWWDGSAGTRFWIDPEEGLIALVMAQVSPARGGGFREEFRTLVDEALEERRRR
jgi:CubicO group peptidase (beta-lactamase class C family)